MEWLLIYLLMYRNEDPEKVEATEESYQVISSLLFSLVVFVLKTLQLMGLNGNLPGVFQSVSDTINMNADSLFPLIYFLLMLMIVLSLLTFALTVKGLLVEENDERIEKGKRRVKATIISLIVLFPNLFWFV